MVSISTVAKADSFSRIRWIQKITILWMSIEAVVSSYAAWLARSPALLAFGGDSTIELASAMVVLWEFSKRSESQKIKPQAAKVAGALLIALAVYVSLMSALSLMDTMNPDQPNWAWPYSLWQPGSCRFSPIRNADCRRPRARGTQSRCGSIRFVRLSFRDRASRTCPERCSAYLVVGPSCRSSDHTDNCVGS